MLKICTTIALNRSNIISRIQLIIFTLLLYQFLVGSPLDNPSLLQNHNAVTILDSGQSVGNHKGSSATHQLIHTILHDFLRTGINGAGCLIQNQDRRVCYRSPTPL